MDVFENRVEAGRLLAQRLAPLATLRPVVLGLPRGGVPVAAEVAHALGAPLDVIVVRKLGFPGEPEVAMGAIGEGGARVLSSDLVRRVGVADAAIAEVERQERTVLDERVSRLRSGRPRVDLTGRTALIVDDGIATGATAEVACGVARALGASRVIVAAPVCPPEVAERLSGADEVICLATPADFTAVGRHYRDFRATSDEEVAALLAAASAADPDPVTPGESSGASERGAVPPEGAAPDAMAAQIRALALPLDTAADLAPLVSAVARARFVAIGEASHGTHEYYQWRADLSRTLISHHGYRWIGVEGDWPDCWRINEWVQGRSGHGLSARTMLSEFERWPTWMWANEEVADFLDWLRDWNAAHHAHELVAFYGLDVYSLWDSLREIIGWLDEHAPEALPAALRAWQCFVPAREDPHEYAWGTRLVPHSCEADVVALLSAVRAQALASADADDAAFDALQNAEVAAGAERYYRTMVRGDRESWNVRDRHMADTVERIARHHGPASKGLVWEHNTHVGDARATDMAAVGMLNVGQLLRERHSGEGVALVGFAGYAGTVVAASAWGVPERVLEVPRAAAGSHEAALHAALGHPALLVFGEDRTGAWLGARFGHRAIGVVYEPRRETGNYVPTRMGERYDALLWFERTTALRPLHHEAFTHDPELETEPTGF